jgi:hypothetical protein
VSSNVRSGSTNLDKPAGHRPSIRRGRRAAANSNPSLFPLRRGNLNLVYVHPSRAATPGVPPPIDEST